MTQRPASDAIARPVRIGVLGCGGIAGDFIRGVADSPTVTVAAVASRSPDKAAAFGRQFGVAGAFGSYEALLAEPALDMVYIALPNALHADWSIAASRAGKHVLCEKPLAPTFADAQAMVAAARANDVYLFEAYPYLAQPQFIRVREIVAQGLIGDLRLIQAGFSVLLSGDADIRLDPTLAGGALLDLGCYPVSLIRVLAGARPVRVTALAHRNGSSPETTLVATMEHADGLIAQVACSFATAFSRKAVIAGTMGAIETNYSNHGTTDWHPSATARLGTQWTTPDETIPSPATDGFRAEAEAAADAILNGPDHWPGATATESLDIAMTFDALREAALGRVPVDI